MDDEAIKEDASSEFTKEELELLIDGPIWKAIASMSVPMMLTALAISAATFADAFVAGKLGPDELAAVGIGGQIWFGLTLMAIAIASGANALVSRFWGAKDYSQAMEAARQSLFCGVIFGTLSAIVGFCSTDLLLHLLGASDQVAALGSSYLKLQFMAQLPMTMLWVCHSIFRARGEATLPTIVMGAVTAAVVLLDLALVLFPMHIGITGIGLAWLISTSIGCVFMLALLKKSDLSECMEISKEHPLNFSSSWMKRILNIGLPACMQDLAWVCSNFGLFLIFSLTKNPTDYQAAWAVGLRVEDVLAGLPIFATSMGVATVVGQNIGAGKLDRATKVGWHAAAYGSILMMFVGALMFFAAEPIAKAMSNDADVILYSTQYFQILGISEPIIVIWFILFGAMEGAGYTRVPMYFSFFCLLLIRLPIAYFLTLTLNWGAIGAWASFGLTSIVATIGTAIWYQRGSWKHHQI